MKVSIGMRIQEGPWGGGNQFGKSLVQYLTNQGHQVYFDLKDPNIDIIILTDPRPELPSNAFTMKDIVQYIRKVNPQALVIHRINECDERKNTKHMNKLLVKANQACADHTVFISSWLQGLFLYLGVPTERSSVILNGGDSAIFHAHGYHPWSRKEKLSLVTHHWGSSWNKGFDIYMKIDQMLDQEPYRSRIDFTYIGNLPKGLHFKNARTIAPLSGKALADELRKHHVYVTGTVNEPAGMHHIEGSLCGLPLLYRNSGALPEYCNNFGIPFEGEKDFSSALDLMIRNYEKYMAQMGSYAHSSKEMCHEYLQLFEKMLLQRQNYLAARSPQIGALRKILFRPKPHQHLFDVLGKQDIAIDCGANVGKITALMAQHGATVYAFEPNPYAFGVLEKRFAKNKKVVCIQKGVWVEKSTRKLFFHANSSDNELLWSTGSSMIGSKSNVDQNKFVEIDTVDLAAFLSDLEGRVRLLKIDIEGAECEVVHKIIDQELNHKIDAILVETHDHKINELKPETDRLRKRIAQMGITNIHLDWV